MPWTIMLHKLHTFSDNVLCPQELSSQQSLQLFSVHTPTDWCLPGTALSPLQQRCTVLQISSTIGSGTVYLHPCQFHRQGLTPSGADTAVRRDSGMSNKDSCLVLQDASPWGL